MSKTSLAILEKLTGQSRSGSRLKDLLKDPKAEHHPDWYMAVPPCFNDALDIKWNCGASNSGWTQSGCFAFKTADTFYDTPRAYEVWSEALKHLNLCVEIEAASSAGQGEGGTRYPGSVSLAFFTPNADRTKIVKRGTHSMSQDDFVRFLIAGPDAEFKAKIEEAQHRCTTISNRADAV
jgi:hypothetical protein